MFVCMYVCVYMCRRKKLEHVGRSVEELHSQWEESSEDERVKKLTELLKVPMTQYSNTWNTSSKEQPSERGQST